MKNLIALFLAGFATLAVAGETSAVQTPTVESYSYGTKLDMHGSSACRPFPMYVKLYPPP